MKKKTKMRHLPVETVFNTLFPTLKAREDPDGEWREYDCGSTVVITFMVDGAVIVWDQSGQHVAPPAELFELFAELLGADLWTAA